jgi:mitochondrial fission protein ELM1
MEDIIREIQERGKTEYVDFEQRIYDALVAADQAVIDNLSEINDSINDSNARLLDSIQTAIDEQRQARERDEQRNDIEEKQRRLALLRSDTSGAYALEIKALEEEIGDLQNKAILIL